MIRLRYGLAASCLLWGLCTATARAQFPVYPAYSYSTAAAVGVPSAAGFGGGYGYGGPGYGSMGYGAGGFAPYGMGGFGYGRLGFGGLGFGGFGFGAGVIIRPIRSAT